MNSIVSTFEGYSYNRSTNQLYRNAFGANYHIKPINGLYRLKKKGKVYELTVSDLERLTDIKQVKVFKWKGKSLENKMLADYKAGLSVKSLKEKYNVTARALNKIIKEQK